MKKSQKYSKVSPKSLPIPRPILLSDETNVAVLRKDRRSMKLPNFEDLLPSPSKNNNNYLNPATINVDTESPTYRVSDLHPEKLDYPTPNRPFSALGHPISRATSPQQKSTSSMSTQSPSIETSPHQNVTYISEELRSQLPWSYTNIFMDPQVQRKIHSHLQANDEDEPRPPIPIPDYTLHHPKRERPKVEISSTQQSKSHSRW